MEGNRSERIPGLRHRQPISDTNHKTLLRKMAQKIQEIIKTLVRNRTRTRGDRAPTFARNCLDRSNAERGRSALAIWLDVEGKNGKRKTR